MTTDDIIGLSITLGAVVFLWTMVWIFDKPKSPPRPRSNDRGADGRDLSTDGRRQRS